MGSSKSRHSFSQWPKMSSSSFDDTAQAMTQPMAQAKCRKAAHFRVALLPQPNMARLWKAVATMRDEATTVKNEIRDVRSEVHELTRTQVEAATVNAELHDSFYTTAEEVKEGLHDSMERWTELKQENEQLKIEMLNLKQENAWLNAAVANMQACLVRWGAPLADPVVGPPPPGLTDLN